MYRQVHSPAGKSHLPLKTTLVAKSPTAQPRNAPQPKLSDPKYNFNLSKIPISSPDKPLDKVGKLQSKLGAGIHPHKNHIFWGRHNLKTPPVQPRLKVSLSSPHRLQQQVTREKEKPSRAKSLTNAIALPSNPLDDNNPESRQTKTSENTANFAVQGRAKLVQQNKKRLANNKQTKKESSKQKVSSSEAKEDTSPIKAATSGAKAPSSPGADPAFQAVVSKGKKVADQEKQHEPAKTKADHAQNAAVAPPSEVESKGQANQMGEMEQAETPAFDRAAFKARLMERIAEKAPQNLEDADNFKNNNNLDAVKGELSSEVEKEQEGSQKPLEDKSKEAPDTSGIEPKPVTPLPPTPPGAAPVSIGAEQAVPKAKGKGEVEAPLQQNSQQLDQQMAEADLTEEQLAKSNEPEFQTALTAKKEAKTNANQAPKAYRQGEQGTLSQAQGEALANSQAQLQGMHGDRAKLLTQVVGKQGEAKGKDEESRAKVADDIQQIYSETQTKVETTLSGLDTKVATAFDTGAAKAKQLFEDYVDERMSAYKSERYDGITGGVRWAKDKLFGMPSEVNTFYKAGKQLYLNKMDRVIDQVVNIVGDGLSKAKTEIANGRKRVQKYVDKLPDNLKTIGQEAASDIQSEFDGLEDSVDAKQDELINTLAQKYNENVQAIDAKIDEMKAANQGLVDKAVNSIKSVIETINKLKDMLLRVLAKAAGVIGNIIKDPIGFLGNLVKGLKQGFDNFAANIGKHLQAGLIGWLTGVMGSMGIQIPDDIFSLQGIFDLVTQILGLTFSYIRNKAVKKFGEPIVAGIEQSVEIFQLLQERGAMGLWEHVQEQFSDLKETVIEEIKGMVITQVITAGVKWIIGLLNPASAFVKAAMAIYDIIMFFINRGSQVMELVNAVVEAISAIASGAVGGAAKLVENALAKALPVVIGFLASLLGVGGLAKKVERIIGRIRQRIDKAIDSLLLKVKGLFKGKKGKANKDKDGEFTQKDKDAGLAAFEKEEKPFVKNGAITQVDARKVGNIVKNKHPVFKSISVIDGKDSWDYKYIFRAKVDTPTKKSSEEDIKLPKGSEIGRFLQDKNTNEIFRIHSIDQEHDVVNLMNSDGQSRPRRPFIKDFVTDFSSKYIIFEFSKEIPKMPRVVIQFERTNPSHDLAEFKRQIKGQEAGLNSMTIQAYLNNKDVLHDPNLKKTKEGVDKYEREDFRKKEEERLIRLYENRLVDELYNEKFSKYKREFKLKGKEDKEAETLAAKLAVDESIPLAEEMAKDKAAEEMANTAATHDADKEAGGNIWGLTRLGNANINSSIGAQWTANKRRGRLKMAVQSFIKSKDYIEASPEKQRLAVLRVKLILLNKVNKS